MEEKIVLDVVNLTKNYGNRVAVNNLSFSIKSGEILGFLGSNGAGKSTTMKMLMGLANITNGDAIICGKSIKSSFEKAIVNVGGMIETPNFYSFLTGYQNLKFYAKLYKNIGRRKIIEVANLLGLTARIHDKVKNYSLGMKQRLGIAQALLHEPKLLILDEPTNGLDANGIREINLFLKRIAKQKGTAIMVSSHILSLMENLCDTICIIDQGKIVETKTISEIKKSYSKHGTHFIKTNKPNFAGKIIQRIFNINVGVTKNKVLLTTDEEKLADIIVKLSSYKVPIFGAGEIDFSLEEMFLNIVGKKSNIE
ncbi:MAG: ABC transporter ATP-binding protein [Clostridia bacterium]|nr:ABC transporter ATP-binding protein [Clostridia bacterium]